MQKSSNAYPVITCSALGLGILGDGLLRAHPLGLNLTIWTVFLLAAAALLSRLHKPLPSSTYMLVGVAALFSLTFLWRDSLTLKWLSGIAAFMSFALAAQRVKPLPIRLAGIMTYVLALIDGLLVTIRGAGVLLARDFLPWWRHSGRGERRRSVLAAIRGIVIALPLILVFGGLLASADIAYRRILADLFNLKEILKHMAMTLFCAWLAAGFLKGLLDGAATRVKLPDEVDTVKLGAIETGVVMALLDLLFLSFVIVQFRYLFGGEDRIRQIAGLTYAEYARRVSSSCAPSLRWCSACCLPVTGWYATPQRRANARSGYWPASSCSCSR